MKKAIFLDRDGTINEDRGYVFSTEHLHIYRWSYPAIKMLKEAGYLVIVVTNQAGVARGFLTEEMLKDIHQFMLNKLSVYGAKIDAVYYSVDPPFKPSDMRKPAPGMVLKAAEEFDIDLSASYVIGDKIEDLLLAKNAGCRGIMVKTGYGAGLLRNFPEKVYGASPVYIAEDLADAALWITEGRTKEEMKDEILRLSKDVYGMMLSATSNDFTWDELQYFTSMGMYVVLEVGGPLSLYEIETAYKLGAKGISLTYIDGEKTLSAFVDVMKRYPDMKMFVSLLEPDVDISPIAGELNKADGLILYHEVNNLSGISVPIFKKKGVFMVECNSNVEVDLLQRAYEEFKNLYFPLID